MKTITMTIRLLEDVDSLYWEPISSLNETRIETWKHLSRKAGYEPVCAQTNDIPAAIERMIRVAKSKGFSVTRHPRYKDKFILRHALPLLPLVPEEIGAIDLKWSLWSPDRATWNEHKTALAYRKMRRAFLGHSGPVTLRTAPRKEIQCGAVTVSKGCAAGTFACAWDEAEELAGTLGVECDAAFVECLPGSMYLCGVGVERSFSVRARTFQSMMERIDREEDALLGENKETWNAFEAMFKQKAA